jgi:hypothetical protein
MGSVGFVPNPGEGFDVHPCLLHQVTELAKGFLLVYGPERRALTPRLVYPDRKRTEEPGEPPRSAVTSVLSEMGFGMTIERPLVSFGRGPSGKLVKRESGVRTQRYV